MLKKKKKGIIINKIVDLINNKYIITNKFKFIYFIYKYKYIYK